MILLPTLSRRSSNTIRVQVFGLFWGLLLAFRVESASAQAQFNPSTESGSDDSEVTSPVAEGGTEKKKPKGANFNQYAQSLRLICSQLDEDGRRETMFKILEPLHEELPDCPGCKSLLRSFASVCKAARARPSKKKIEKAVAKEEHETEQATGPVEGQEAGNEAVPTPKVETVPVRHLQREPSTKLIDTLSTTLIQLSEDERRSGDAARAMQALALALANPDDKTPGERDYFEILSAYVYAPFASILEKGEEKPEQHGEHAQQEKAPVDDLFSF